MGKPGKWLKAVKNAFRSPSKDRSDDKDETKRKPSKTGRGKDLTLSKAVPTPLPLPSVVGIADREIEQDRNNDFSRDESVAQLENAKVDYHSRDEAVAEFDNSEANDHSGDEALTELENSKGAAELENSKANDHASDEVVAELENSSANDHSRDEVVAELENSNADEAVADLENSKANDHSRNEMVVASEISKANNHPGQETLPFHVVEDVQVSKEYGAHREEQAAIQIQRAFRNHLASTGVVPLQTVVRGQTVRRQTATTLRAMEALVRVQARVRARRVRMSEEGQAVQQQILQRRLALSRPKASGGTWTTGQDSKEKLQIREEAARKRERAMAYASSQQQKRNTPKRNTLFIDNESDQSHWGWSWMDRWMAARPWEDRQIDPTKEGTQSLSSVKLSESKPTNIKTDGVSLQSTRRSSSPTSQIEKLEDKPKKGHRSNGVSGNVPLPLPSPPSSDDHVLIEPDVLGKAPSPEKPTILCSQETKYPRSLPPVEILVPVGLGSDAAPSSPADSSPFNHQRTTNYTDSNSGVNHASNDKTLEHGRNCSGSCGSEHETNEVASIKANPLDSPMSDHMKAEADATSTPVVEGEVEDGKNEENGENSVPNSQKSTRSRYMLATVSAKAKARTSPKTRVEVEESPVKQQKRLSFGSTSVSRSKSPNMNGTTRSKPLSQMRASLNGGFNGGLFKDKSVEALSPVDSGAHPLLRRKSFGGEPKSATKWR